MLVTLLLKIAYVTAGPLADKVFELLLSPSGALASSLGVMFGVGEGRGIALMFVLFGILAMVTALSGFLSLVGVTSKMDFQTQNKSKEKGGENDGTTQSRTCTFCGRRCHELAYGQRT